MFHFGGLIPQKPPRGDGTGGYSVFSKKHVHAPKVNTTTNLGYRLPCTAAYDWE